MKSINNFNLSLKSGRYAARKAGFDIPYIRPPRPKRRHFEEYIDKSGDCWLWTDSVNKWGYGVIHKSGTTIFPHRMMWEKANGRSAKGFVVMHKCDNPRCCNPAHLSLGTHHDNQMDKVAKNRQAKGERNGSSILKEEQVIEARNLYASGKFRYIDLAEKYNVSRDTIQKAIRHIYWKHI